MLSSRPLNTTYKLPFAVSASESLQTGCRPSLTTVSQPLCPRMTSCPMSWRESCIEHDFKSLRPKWRWDDFWIPQKRSCFRFSWKGKSLGSHLVPVFSEVEMALVIDTWVKALVPSQREAYREGISACLFKGI